ncbi:hypothetical protein PPL_05156 [Heterostelium album PN500]|uniref:O-methyltransferase C-terminal domain-containing protein n=1 Tax=Heterostelium pallidum (strain ATCC 26659 / Pp 5 / PN500) TaxID=670386 RepID=D3B9L2_HETP5|nr:hypothetical protein PPL_05156 [Heterostelium album PN500]EFA81924.1 hypothetical protein PPL_05156 [Heterostelium album PN500]|eukprot:XP_020434041.1 hypothetical protein PPL_05156 [Heterostelium album PN500]
MEPENKYKAVYENIVKFQDFAYIPFYITTCVNSIARLRVTEKIGATLESKKSSDDIAAELHINPDYLYRTMHFLALNGFFVELPGNVFQHTQLSLTLTDPSVRDETLMMNSNIFNRSFETLSESIVSGVSMAPKAWGATDLWDAFGKDPKEETEFTLGMTAITTRTSPVLAELGNYSNYETICDLGGSQGILLAEILRQYPSVKSAINFDQAYVFENSKGQDRAITKNPRYSEHPGNFFESVPTADLYILKSILHDWTDEKSRLILNTIAKSCKPTSKVHIMEYVMDDGPKGNEAYVSMLDILLLQVCDGKERTKKQFEGIVGGTPFTIETILKPTLLHSQNIIVLKLK